MYIITGGAGFIGSAFLWQLNKSGINNVLIVDNLNTSTKWKNLVNLDYTDYIHKNEFIQLVKNKKLAGKIRGIIHLGACSSTTETDADYLMENNFHYSVEVAKLATNNGIPLINASSASTYGDGSLGFDDNEDLITKLRPLNMYGYSKQLFDIWLMKNELHHKVFSLKFFNVIFQTSSCNPLSLVISFL